jgi:ABC-2 type transport system permease protein
MRTTAVFKAITKNWLRSRSGLFFSFLFPVMFLLIFGSIFGNANAGGYTLYVQNNDACPPSSQCLSALFVAALNSTKVVSVNTSALGPDSNITEFIQLKSASFGDTPRVLVIPRNFTQSLEGGHTVKLVYISSPADQIGPVVGSVIASVSDAFNFRIAEATPLIGIVQHQSTARPLKSVDYYLPGLIAAFMMTNGVIGLTSIASEFKRRGLTRRLSATPLTKFEWMLGNVLSQTVLALLLATVMILLAEVVYHTTVTLDIYTFVLLVSGAILFSGIGMTLAGLVTDPEAASGLGNAIAFPMMFLSGTFWPVDIMPSFLQQIARVLPLTYFSDGLRDSMILAEQQAAVTNLLIVAAFAIAFILLGARATRWKES